MHSMSSAITIQPNIIMMRFAFALFVLWNLASVAMSADGIGCEDVDDSIVMQECSPTPTPTGKDCCSAIEARKQIDVECLCKQGWFEEIAPRVCTDCKCKLPPGFKCGGYTSPPHLPVYIVASINAS
ncbi:hypothetical protein RIF29_40033 [Crotalaria pallida]|uniref:Uncharacterized protein n=1 Tax=Crotalaria pallida TaxID=3830 RepID=A0AAN9E5D9_CROPI